MRTGFVRLVVVGTALLASALAGCGGTSAPAPQAGTESAQQDGARNGAEPVPSGGEGRHAFLDTTCTEGADGSFQGKLTDLETIESIFPPGGAAGWEVKPHGYVLIKGDEAAIYAPTDMELVQGSFYREPGNPPDDLTYILHFAVGCDFAMFIDHISDPVERIRAVLNTEPREDTRLDSFLAEPVRFKAGELIARTMGGRGPGGIGIWDFGYYGASTTNEYVNQERYLRSDAWKQLHAVCGFDYFPEPWKSSYVALFSTRTGTFVPGVGCRSPNRDVKGSLSGAWFFTQESMSVEPHVAIAGDIDGTSLTIAGLPSMKYLSISGTNPTYADPASVNGRHCYAGDGDASRHFFFVLVDEMTLDVYEGSGPCPSSPQGTKTTLYR